ASLAVALFPGVVVRATGLAAAQILGTGAAGAAPEAPLATIGTLDGVLWVALAATVLAFLAVIRRRRPATGPTWGCGYAGGGAR
ncbi:hypothetical protein, partial [Klebsiella pneumoniae]|uniref:hypothetical protein n=1 Tax=Klebsiella pneumoniae TaxID=573 RepID=UPI003013224B